MRRAATVSIVWHRLTGSARAVMWRRQSTPRPRVQSFPVLAEDQFTAKLYANKNAKSRPPTGCFALQVIHVKVAYDKVFTLKNAVSALYSGKTETKEAVNKQKKPFSTSEWIFTQKVTDEKLVRGDDVLLATLTFEVASNAPKQETQGIPLSVEIVGMASGAGLKVVNYEAGSVYDYQGDPLALSGHVKIATATDVAMAATKAIAMAIKNRAT